MSFIDKSPLLAGLNYAKGQVLTNLNLRGHFSGSTAHHMTLEESLRYVTTVVSDYLTYGAGGDSGRLRGKDVLEVGPGDNLGVALLLLAKGARTVTCVDGFRPVQTSEHNAQLYAAIHASLSQEEKERLQDVLELRPDGSAQVRGERLRSHYGSPIDRDVDVLGAAKYDVIVSRAVLEHLGNLAKGWQAMVRALRPAGEMWHKVDFRCHNLFGQIHPLYFLTVSSPWWEYISQPDPTLNRLRLPAYREMIARDFKNSTIYLTSVIGIGKEEILPHVRKLELGVHYDASHLDLVRRIRPQLQPPFSSHTDEELLVTGIFLSAQDPYAVA